METAAATRHVVSAVTVRKLGVLLEPALEKLQFGDHPIKALRLPTNSVSTQKTSSELEVLILGIWWNHSDDSEQGARRLRALLTPKER